MMEALAVQWQGCEGKDVTDDDFRALALGLPEAVEGWHMSHPDFRVGKKIFATLSDDYEFGVVRLTPGQQAEYAAAHAGFEALPGGWGAKGYTKVILRKAKKAAVKSALRAAWLNTAPRKMHGMVDR